MCAGDVNVRFTHVLDINKNVCGNNQMEKR